MMRKRNGLGGRGLLFSAFLGLPFKIFPSVKALSTQHTLFYCFFSRRRSSQTDASTGSEKGTPSKAAALCAAAWPG